MSEGNFSTEYVQKRVLRYDPRCLEHPYVGHDGEKRLQEMADREGLILLPLRFVDKAEGLPVLLTEQGGGFPGTLREWYAGMAMQVLAACPSFIKGLDDAAMKAGLRFKDALSDQAFELADAMLAESKRGNS